MTREALCFQLYLQHIAKYTLKPAIVSLPNEKSDNRLNQSLQNETYDHKKTATHVLVSSQLAVSMYQLLHHNKLCTQLTAVKFNRNTAQITSVTCLQLASTTKASEYTQANEYK